jgi:hypothetical protein
LIFMGNVNEQIAPSPEDKGTGTDADLELLAEDDAQGDAPSASGEEGVLQDVFPSDSELPTETQQLVKKWKAGYTKKRQAETKELAELREKAAVHDGMLQDPEIAQYLIELRNRRMQGQAQPSQRGQSGEDYLLDEDVSGGAQVPDEVNRTMQNLSYRVDQLQASQQAAAFAAANPDWEQHRDGMEHLRKEYPNIPVQALYEIAKNRATQAKLQEIRARRKVPAVESPDAGTSHGKREHKIDDFHDAVLASLDELKMDKKGFV